LSGARGMIRQEAVAAIDELRRDVLSGKGGPRLIAALALIFARQKKDEFRAWVQSRQDIPHFTEADTEFL
jgi:hypothetical protein